MPQLALTEAVFYILLSLQKPLHGYGIIQNVGELSHGRVKLAAGTLYGALNSLVEKGWIDALPENIGNLKGLTALYMKNTKISSLPASFNDLHLDKLEMSGSPIK